MPFFLHLWRRSVSARAIFDRVRAARAWWMSLLPTPCRDIDLYEGRPTLFVLRQLSGWLESWSSSPSPVYSLHYDLYSPPLISSFFPFAAETDPRISKLEDFRDDARLGRADRCFTTSAPLLVLMRVFHVPASG